MKQWSRHWQMQTFERVWRTLGWRFHRAISKLRKPLVRSKNSKSKSGGPSSRLAASRWSRAAQGTNPKNLFGIAQVGADAFARIDETGAPASTDPELMKGCPSDVGQFQSSRGI